MTKSRGESSKEDAPVNPLAAGLSMSLVSMAMVGAIALCGGMVGGEHAMLAIGVIVGLSVAAALLGASSRHPLGRTAAYLGIGFAVLGMGATWLASQIHISRGRALRRRGRARFPQEMRNASWVDAIAPIDAPREAAAAWRENAATETASVAAFSHLATELLALGAPAHLVEAAHADALDEIRHARACYGIARAIDGDAIGPGVFAAAATPADAAVTHRTLAIDCIVESMFLEAASAEVARRLADATGIAAIREVLAPIAVDERRHADHGRAIVAWCLAREGGSLVPALRSAIARAARTDVQRDASLEPYGIASAETWRASLAVARAEVDAWLDRRDQSADVAQSSA